MAAIQRKRGSSLPSQLSRTRHLCRVLTGLVFVAFLQVAAAQSSPRPSAAIFDLDHDREVDVSLRGQWRFKTGDDPSWSSPNLDDSRWPLIKGSQRSAKNSH